MADKTLAQRLDEGYAEAWRPEPGDSVVGFVVEISTRENEYGVYPIVTVEQADGTSVAIHAMQTTLKEAMVRGKPTLGEEIAVKYSGKRLPKSWTPPAGLTGAALEAARAKAEYHDFRVIVERAPQDVWGAFAPQQ